MYSMLCRLRGSITQAGCQARLKRRGFAMAACHRSMRSDVRVLDVLSDTGSYPVYREPTRASRRAQGVARPNAETVPPIYGVGVDH